MECGWTDIRKHDQETWDSYSFPVRIPMKKLFFLPKAVKQKEWRRAQTHTPIHSAEHSMDSMSEINTKELSHSNEQVSPGVWRMFSKESIKNTW